MGHQKQWQQLVAALQQNRLAHALLLISESPEIALNFAEQFMQLLLCDQYRTGASCNACRSCLLFKSNNHPNITRLQTDKDNKTIKIDQIRSCVESLQHTAVIGQRKIVLISLVEHMNVAASNALLKTLEEPTGDTIFILITQNIHTLLPTIKSRCQKVYFPVTTTIEVPTEFSQKIKLFLNKELTLSEFVTWCLKQYSLKQNLAFLSQILFILAKENQKNHKPNAKLFRCYDILLATEKTLLENVHLNEALVMENLLIEMSA